MDNKTLILTQICILHGKILTCKRKEDDFHATLRLPENTNLHLVFREKEAILQLGKVLSEGPQPHVQVIVNPMSYHKPGVGNMAAFEVLEITHQSDFQAVINQCRFALNFINQRLLQTENRVLTNNGKHDILLPTVE